MAVALLLSVPLGVAAAARKGTWVDRGAMAFALGGMAMPRFWLGPLLIILFSIKLDLLPVSGAREGWVSYVLPAATLGTALGAMVSRMTRASVLEVLGEDFVRTARAKGLSGAAVLWKHALRAALVPVITVVALQFGALLGGAIVTEKVFNWPGMGTLLLTAISQRDYNTTRACVLIFTALYIGVNLFADLLYAAADPRMRDAAEEPS
jgi:peptide/nickel transport system permease protein